MSLEELIAQALMASADPAWMPDEQRAFWDQRQPGTAQSVGYGQWPAAPMDALDASAFIPGVGDITGPMADARMFLRDPEQLTPGNLGLTGLGLLPFVGGATAVRGVADVLGQWKARGISGAASERDGVITLSKIVVPKEARQQGLGTQAMRELLDYADATGQRVALSPSADFGGSKARLERFYKRLGFARNKDQAVSETMIREPRAGLAQTMKPAPYDEAHRIAQRNAALPVEQGGLGLPPDNMAMDRAAAMGFDLDTPLYHGTGVDIAAFQPDSPHRFAAGSGGPQARAAWLTRGPAEASRYAGSELTVETGAGNPNVLPLFVRPGRTTTVADRYDVPSALPGADTVNVRQDLYSRLAGEPQHWTVVKDPSRIRSRFAAFDPMKRDSSDLLASIAPWLTVGGLAALLYPQEDRP